MNENTPGKEKETESGIAPQPEPETLHKTHPQKNMEGPVSSSMDKIGNAFNTSESKEEADRDREENM